MGTAPRTFIEVMNLSPYGEERRTEKINATIAAHAQDGWEFSNLTVDGDWAYIWFMNLSS